MNSKGYFVLKSFVEKYGSDCISYVISCKDHGVSDDFSGRIKALSADNSIRYFDRHDNNKDIQDTFSGWRFAIGWKWIIEDSSQLVVFHDSLLPKYRGFAPLVNSLINNETKAGVTALLASDKYDEGDVIDQLDIEIDYPIKIDRLIKQIEPLYFSLVSKVFLKIRDNENLTSYPQDENQATYGLWLDEKDYFINWTWSADKIKRFVDATGYPYNNAKSYLNNKIVKFIDVEVVNDVVIKSRDRHVGKVIFVKKEGLVVVCRKGLLLIKNILDNDNNKLNINFRSRFE